MQEPSRCETAKPNSLKYYERDRSKPRLVRSTSRREACDAKSMIQTKIQLYMRDNKGISIPGPIDNEKPRIVNPTFPDVGVEPVKASKECDLTPHMTGRVKPGGNMKLA